MRDHAVWVDEEIHLSSLEKGALSGQRLAVKDLFDVKGHVTGCGNPDWKATHVPAEHTAEAVMLLLQAGAEMIGKTQTDELAYSLNGCNVHYGTPVNPASPDRIPGGSSSGSAVAVASGQADIGLGTDTGGSIRVPSSYCGLYGLRPTWGAISDKGLVGLAERFDTVGLMCRSGGELREAAEVLLPEHSIREYSSVCVLEPQGVAFNSGMIKDKLSTLALDIHSASLDVDTMSMASEAFRVLQGRDIWRTHGEWLERCQPHFADDIAVRLKWCSTLTELDETNALASSQRIIGWLRELSAEGERLLCLPSAPGAAPLLTLKGESLANYRTRLMGMTALSGLWGAPVLALPWLEDEGAPWGISMMAAPGDDRSLLALLDE